MQTFQSNSELNYTQWTNQEYDKILQDIAATPLGEQAPLIQKANQIILENVPILPLYFVSGAYLISNRVQGYERSPYNHCQYHFVSFKKE